jgi:hypothetical protein
MVYFVPTENKEELNSEKEKEKKEKLRFEKN